MQHEQTGTMNQMTKMIGQNEQVPGAQCDAVDEAKADVIRFEDAEAMTTLH
jgi:hypothetical protein